MAGPALLLVPGVVRSELFKPFVDYGFLVLDVLLDQGYAGVVFRRLRLIAACDPMMRVKYDSARSAYLSEIVPLIVGQQQGVVVVGTHPADVDLLDFSSVTMLGVAEPGLRKLSEEVYGEPVMLSTEFALVRSVVWDSVDCTRVIPEWSALGVFLARYYRHSVVGYGRVSESTVRGGIELSLRSATLPVDLMEPLLDFDMPLRDGGIPLIIFDYLSVIKVDWRDPVVGILGKAPNLEAVFRLPWYVFDPVLIRRLCYRTNLMGELAVSMQGQSLVDLVTSRMNGAFSVGELVGTWVGALLTEPEVVEQVVGVLQGRSMIVSNGHSVAPEFSTSCTTAVCAVTGDMAWLYSACVGVVVIEEESDHERLIESGAVVAPPSLQLAKRFLDVTDLRQRAHVVAFISRVHAMGDTASEFIVLLTQAMDSVNNGGLSDVKQLDCAHLLPGMTYLSMFARGTREAALATLGTYPTLGDCNSYVFDNAFPFGDALSEAFRLIAVRGSVMAGATVSSDVSKLPVGADEQGIDVIGYDPGYCYLVLFQASFVEHAKALLGCYPTLASVMALPVEWRIADYGRVVRVTAHSSLNFDVPVLHFSHRGLPLSDVVDDEAQMEYNDAIWKSNFGQARVGDRAPVEYKWFVLAVVSLTVNVVVFLMLIAWMIYKCRGQSRGAGSGGGYRGGGYRR